MRNNARNENIVLKRTAPQMSAENVGPDQHVEDAQQSLDPTDEHHQRNPKSTPKLRERHTDLGILDGVVLMNMIQGLELGKQSIP